MVLEKLVRSAKIATTNRWLYAVSLYAGIAIAGSLGDGKVEGDDAILLTFAGAVLGLGAVATRKELYEHDRISDYCKHYEFTEWFMRNPVDRRKARIYAAESGRMDQFELALKEYRL